MLKQRNYRRLVLPLAAAMVVLPCWSAYAVVPAVMGPAQALVAILPQLLAMLGAAMLALFKPETSKTLFKFLWHQKMLSLGIVAAAVLCVWGLGKLFGGSVAREEAGAPWGTRTRWTPSSSTTRSRSTGRPSIHGRGSSGDGAPPRGVRKYSPARTTSISVSRDTSVASGVSKPSTKRLPSART